MPPVIPDIDARGTIELLQSLLHFHTENPPGNEGPAARFLADYLRPFGFETTYYESAPERGSLVARLPGSGGGRSLIMNGHLDIGPIGTGWTRDPWGGEIEDGRIYGRGSGDMKSGIAAMVSAAVAIARSRLARRGDLILMPTADESSGGHQGMGYLVRSGIRPKADMAVICEPTFGDISIAHRGAVWAEIVVRGKSGQASRPASGINAIMAMGRVLTALATELPPRFGGRTHPLVPSPTLNAGMIEGGVKPNVIAEQCRAVLDRRMLPSEPAEAVLEELRAVADAAVQGTGASVAVNAVMVKPGSEVPADSEIVAECQQAFRSVTGRTAEIRGSAGYTDAHWFNLDFKIPAVMFGPWYLHRPAGSVSDIPDECNYVEDVLTGTRVYAQLIANVIG